MVKVSVYLSVLVCAVVFLTACGPVYKTKYRYQTPVTKEGQVCANHCLDKMEACKSTCRAEEAQCKRIKRLEAENAYLTYVREQELAGKEVEKTRSHFRSYGSCSTNCEKQCEASQRICHVNCGGNVTESRVCTAFCD